MRDYYGQNELRIQKANAMCTPYLGPHSNKLTEKTNHHFCNNFKTLNMAWVLDKKKLLNFLGRIMHCDCAKKMPLHAGDASWCLDALGIQNWKYNIRDSL